MIRVPQIVTIGAELIKKVMISDFKHFVDNGFGCQMEKNVDVIFEQNPFMMKGKEWKDKRNEIAPALTQSKVCAFKNPKHFLIPNFSKYS